MTADLQNEESNIIPKKIGPYTIESLLQRGGMSLLYLASDPESKSPVAVKVLSQKFLQNEDVVERFLREAHIIEKVDHPNIVRMYSYGSWEGGYYIAMEFVVGISLRHFLLQYPLSLRRALEILLEVSYAVCHLHTHGIIHRDLKLENILITKSGAVRVIDFGIAQLLDDIAQQPQVPYQSRTIGTPVYMSPEQRENPESVSYPSDIYSLGIIAYELVLGRLSHGHVYIGLMPKGLQKIFSKALQPNPRDRYQDIVDFIADLNVYLNSETVKVERFVGDRTTELFESFRRVNLLLMPETPPQWYGFEIGFTSDTSTSMQGGVFGDFISFDGESFAVVFGDSITTDAEKFILSATMRGVVRALFKKQMSPQELVEQINFLLLNDENSREFFLCCLKLQPLKCKIQFISCGYGGLWTVAKGSELLSPIYSKNNCLKSHNAVYKEITGTFEPDQELFLFGSQDYSLETEIILAQGAIEYAGMPVQQKAEAIMRKLRLLSANPSASQAVFAIIRYV